MPDQTAEPGPQYPSSASPPAGDSEKASKDARTMAMLAHLLAIFTGFLGPLILYLVKKDENEFVRFHALQAIYFELLVMAATFVCIPLVFVLIGFLLLPAIGIGAFVLNIIACIKANDGEWYEYPLAGSWARR